MGEEVRLCNKCGSSMDEGYVIQGETYCCEACMPMTVEIYNEMHEELPDENYWTEWDSVYY